MKPPGALRRLRLSAGLTLRQAAPALGIKKSYLANIECGKRPAETEHIRRLLALVRQHSTKENLEEVERVDLQLPVEALLAEHAAAGEVVREALEEIEDGADPGVWIEVAETALARTDAIRSAVELLLRRPE
jgi:transcriptional regulator with XRE-family HTH domain